MSETTTAATSPKKTTDDLVTSLMKAKAIVDAMPNADTGGTCNFDCPELYLPRARETVMKAVSARVDLTLSKWPHGYRPTWHIIGIKSAQGSSQSMKAEAFAKSMKADGWDCSVYYAMD